MPIQASKHEDEQRNPYLPPGPEPLLMEEFAGINTSTTRPGVDEKQCAWIDGFMPIGPRYLRTLYGKGEPIHFEDNASISFFGFANIGSTPYCIVVHIDGSVHAINTQTAAATQIAAPGTIQSPSRLNVGLSQYGSQYVLIVAKQTNGYFLWDGNIFYSSGGIGPVVTLTNVGSGYTSEPSVTVSGGSGSGIVLQAIGTPSLDSIKIISPGSGYLATDTLTVSFSGGGGTGAAATVKLMPFGVSGTTAEIYSGHVWVGNGAQLTYSAPGSVTDFSTANGGGSLTLTDSFLRVRIIQLIQTNGFLYIIADSSVSYISGVQTSGTPATTTFTNQNADPEVGSPWPSTVTTFGRNILFANAFGAHVSYGAAVTKISEPLDGVYNTVSNFGNIIPSAAKAIIFGKKVWILLLPIVDPVSGQQTNKLLIWTGKFWFASNQDIPLIFIQYQEIDSVLTAWGTDGVGIYPLFNTPSNGFSKTVQSKLWTKPIGYQMVKTTSRLWGLCQYYSTLSPELSVTIDNENGSTPVNVPIGPNQVVVVNASGTVIPVQNQSGQSVIVLSAAGIVVFNPTAIAQQGVLLGYTAKTDSADMALISMMIQPEIATYTG